MDRANCQLLKIPPRSPDLNPIENIFKLVSDALRKQAITSRITTETYEQFKDRVISTIKSIPSSGVASFDNWRGEYSYICVHRPEKQSISKEINDAKHDT